MKPRLMGLAIVALMFAVFAPPRLADAVMGQCIGVALTTVDAAVTLCSATVTTSCIGGPQATVRKHLEIDNGSAIDVTANFGAAAVSEQDYDIPAGQIRVPLEISTNAACYGQPGTSTCTAINPNAQLHLIAASSTPTVGVCEW